jgi:heterodisulfide reductase subunit A-like polyferredoxin
MRPLGADTELAKSLGIGTDERGFARIDQDSAGAVFVIGAVSEPMDIEETVVRAISSASAIKTSKEVSQ